MNRTLLDFWVGLFVAIGLVAAVFISLKVANQSSFHSAPTYTVTGYFNNIGGLKMRAPVKSAGVTVGRVTSVQLDTKIYQAKVTMAIDEQYAFSTDSSASILTAGVLGEQYIGIESGAEDAMLKNGDAIHLTSSAVVLEKLIGELGLKAASQKPTGATTSE